MLKLFLFVKKYCIMYVGNKLVVNIVGWGCIIFLVFFYMEYNIFVFFVYFEIKVLYNLDIWINISMGYFYCYIFMGFFC